MGHRTEYTYDSRNRETAVTDALVGTVVMRYDDRGNVVEVTDPVQNTTAFVYDGRNRLKSETNELGQTRSFVYNAVGNPIAMTDRNNRTRTFTYDGLNRQTAEKWLDAGGNPLRAIGFTYDAAGQLIAVSDPDSRYTFTYDALGRQTAVNNAGTPGVPNVLLNYSYDSQGNLLSVGDTINGQAKGVTSYIYDQLNRVSKITQTGNGVASKRVDFSYDNIGQYQSINRYADLNGTQLVAGSTYTYDAKNRLDNLTHSNATSAIAFYNFEYDSADRITQISDVDGTTDYNYDLTNQLTGANHTDVDNPDESYSYDANGNRLTSHKHGSGYVRGANNRLESDGRYSFQYDGEGNLMSRTEIATNKVTEYTWDYRNRLVAVTDKNAGGTAVKKVAFAYDAMDRRLSKTVDANPLDPVGGAVTHFVYDRENVLLEFVDADGVAGAAVPVFDKRYLYGTGVDQVLAQENAGGNVMWHLTDHLGTVRDLVGNSGAVLNHFTYDSFGNVISETNQPVDTRYLFTGREFDGETGLYYYRARYYDGGVGRFLSEDPIGFAGGDVNLYRYVGNTPTIATDPTGLQFIEWSPSPKSAIGMGEELINLSNLSKEWARGIANKLNTEYKGWLDILPDCPCTEEEAKNLPIFSPDRNPNLQAFHPGAKSSFRSQPVPFYKNGKYISEPGQQCTYDFQGQLITSGLGAGTPDFWSPQAAYALNGVALHFTYDVITWQLLDWQEYAKTWKPNPGPNGGKDCQDMACNNLDGIA